MFYLEELLTLRSGGKLSKCWLAATMSEKMFKRTLKVSSIKSINVCLVCEEILTTVEVRQNRIYGRFSLYLSSQLMFGVTKILYYQTIVFQNYLFEVKRKLEQQLETKKETFDVRRALELPHVPATEFQTRDIDLLMDLHTIRDEPYTSAVENMMQDAECLNFGVLTNEEMDLLLSRMGNLTPEKIERIRPSLLERTMDQELEVPLAEISEEAVHEITKETRLTFSKIDKGETIATIDDRQMGGKLPETPRKRTKQTSPPVDTPTTKRSRLDVELEVPGTAEAVVTEQQTAIAVEEIQLEEIEAFAERQRRRRKFFDKVTNLSDKTIKAWYQDVRSHTRKSGRLTTGFPTSGELFTMPSTCLRTTNRSRWAETLLRNYIRHIVGPFFTRELEFSTALEAQDTISGETLRLETTAKSRDQLAELSSKIEQLAVEVTDQSTKMTEKTIPDEIPEPLLLPEEITTKEQPTEEVSVRLPEITGLESEVAGSNEGVLITRNELLALLEVQWTDNEYVKFEELIPASSYDKSDAACAFMHLLDFHAEGRANLKQAAPYETIWIQKCAVYSSD